MRIKKIVVGELKTNCYLVYEEEDMIVIDPGGEGERILKEIEDTGISPKIIINTHSHSDHNLANNLIHKATGAEIISNLKDGDVVRVGNTFLKVLSTPGHSPDSISLYGKKFLISGDLFFEDGHGRTDFAGGSDEEIMSTLGRIKEEIDGDVTVYPGHGRSFLVKNYPFDCDCGKLLKK